MSTNHPVATVVEKLLAAGAGHNHVRNLVTRMMLNHIATKSLNGRFALLDHMIHLEVRVRGVAIEKYGEC